ncbi:MAG: Cleavage stimulation factor subunit 3 [Caeruleum heppii]|nr:MAG: Cleavage stimulation factor subunit 3 [Caeruleum heppii]
MDPEAAFLTSMKDMSGDEEEYTPQDVVTPDQVESGTAEVDNPVQDIKETSIAARSDALDLADPAIPSPATVPPLATSSQPTHDRPSSADDPARSTSLTEAQRDEQSSLQSPVITASQSTASKPRAIGGFVIDDEDDEGGLAPQAGLHGLLTAATSNTASRSMTRSPVPTTPLRNVMLPNDSKASTNGAEAATTDVSSVVPLLSVSATTSNEVSAPSALSMADPPPVTAAEAATTTSRPEVPIKAIPRARLPHDRVGILEDKIKEDPRGDIEAWLSLISEHRKRNKLEDARSVYERFFKTFPSAAEQWVAYANMELAENDFYRLEQIFSRTLLTIPSVQLWSLYLDYVRRRNNLTTDAQGTARTIVSQAYDFVLQNIGIDKDSGRIWQDYVLFIRSGPGSIGGSNWQDQQKMDLLRKTYQRAICIPTSAVNHLWKEYDAFEMGLNKITGRKFLQEKSPGYMTARSSNTELENITRGLIRTTLPKLPPALGFDGDDEYNVQVELWRRWIQWEKNDPLVLKDEDLTAYKSRIVYVYKQAVMALRFWPDIWYEASEFCYENGLEKDGNDFISQGMAANPESCLLAFKRADRLEASSAIDEGEEASKVRGATVRGPYDKVLDALYGLIAQAKKKEAKDISRLEESTALSNANDGTSDQVDDDDDEEREAEKASRENALRAQMKAVQDGTGAQIRTLSRTISFAWIALMRAMRRIQGKGKVGESIGGSRQIFTDARKRGRLTSDVYVASALIEYHCYKDPAATKIFERGMKLFPEDEDFALQYLKHLIAINDITNARAVFETTVNKLAQRPEKLAKAKPIYAFFHDYEAQYGELSQVTKLEKRMSDLFPEDGPLARFSHRYTSQGFDPTAVRPIISPATQMRPRSFRLIENTTNNASTPPYVPSIRDTNSPKRTAPADDSDNESSRPRKYVRGDSPLKGAAGRRLDQQKRTQQANQGPGSSLAQAMQNEWEAQPPPPPPPPPSLPREVLFLLSIIPNAYAYGTATRFKREEILRLLRETNIPSRLPPSQARPPPLGPPGGQQYAGIFP